MNLNNDIYYNPQYSSLYLKDDYSLFEFQYTEGDYFLKNIAIKKPIRQIANLEVEGYFDLETPYGYGGFYCNTNDIDFIKRGMNEYKEKCNKEKIIAEFFSFHPYNNFPKEFSNLFDVCFIDRQVVVLDLTKSDEERWLDYASKNRTILRKCQKTLRTEESKDVDSFIDIYYETMKRNNARGFYYFEKKYFEKLLQLKGIKLIKVLLEDTIIAMSFVMCGEDIGHYHLSANKQGYQKFNANYLLLEEAFNLAKREGCKHFLLGGGRTPAFDDDLFRFKSKFSNLTNAYYLAGNIYNKEVYQQYVNNWEEQNARITVNYFLKYRLNSSSEYIPD